MSSPVTIAVIPVVFPTITITSSANTFCRNALVVFKAFATNGGDTPIYQWKKNGLLVGGNSNDYTDNTLVNEDTVTCTLISNISCLTITQVTSNALRISIHPDPIVILDETNSLCEGSIRTLNAGNFSTYLWNTGSIDRAITINNIGFFSVTVTDNNGCRGTGFTNVTTLLTSPTRFLPGDTSICSYGNLILKPKSSFGSYLWNTGSNSSSITITQSGQYWLEVKDNKGCVGIDSILVLPKECLKGFFMPTAFTPNNDGKNDILKPILLGNVKQFQFWIYNRWGQVVFHSVDLSKGWDGNYKQLNQNGNVFVWVCTYKFESEPLQSKKGTFVLIR